MTTVAFVGLGQMGLPMAGRLLDAGHDLVVWNRTPAKAEPLVARGARQAATPGEAAREAEAVITMVADPAALEEVVFGPSGLSEGLDAESVLIEMSTVGPDAVRDLDERLEETWVLDAPVLGSVRQATDGSLEIFVGGDAEVVEAWAPLLEAMGRVRHLGPIGAGASMKLVTNAVLGYLMAGLGEALALADAFALDQTAVLDVLAESPIGVTVRSKRDHIESGRFPPNFKLSLAAKDLRLVAAAGEQAGLQLPLAQAARAWLEAADRAGLGRFDYSAVTAAARGRPVRGG